MFIAKYGHQCSLYDMMLYFANYLLEYKGSYAQYDVQDILQQFSKKYLPWKRLVTESNEKEDEWKTYGLTLQEMMLIWVRDGRTDEDFKEGGLYRMGRITDKMIEDARNHIVAERTAGIF